jgi:hypothetical protein
VRHDDEPQNSFSLMVIKWNGNPAHCVYLNNHRIVGGKPWGGGDAQASWRFTLEDLQRAFPELEIRLKEVSREP